MRTTILLVLAILAVPMAAAECWDYDCPPPGEDTTGSSSSSSNSGGYYDDAYCELFPEDCNESLSASSNSEGGTFQFSMGWMSLWAGIFGVLIVAGVVIAVTLKTSRVGHRLATIGAGIATLLALIGLFVPMISADFGLASGSANYLSTTIEVLGDAESASWYDDDPDSGAPSIWSEDTIDLMRIALPVAGVAVLLGALGALIAASGRNAAVLHLGAAAALSAALILVMTAMSKEPDMAGTDWSAGFWMQSVAVLLFCIGPAVGYAKRTPRRAPVERIAAAPAAPVRPLLTVRCPKCATSLQGERGSRIQCTSCGAAGRLPA